MERLGADQCCAVGNGLNDAPMLRAARLGIAIVGPEGAGSAALAAAEVVCASIIAALELLLDPVTLASTLRPVGHGDSVVQADDWKPDPSLGTDSPSGGATLW